MEPKIYRYTDPRTGECQWASPADIDAVKHFLMAWKFYWDGPPSEDQDAAPSRFEWFTSEERRAWFESLSGEQQAMLAETSPPEEVPALEVSQ